MPNDKNTKDILDAIYAFSSAVDERSNGMDERLNGIDERLNGIDKRLTKIESLMVTKDYLDDKLADLRGDIVVLVRKEDSKLKKLVDILSKKKIITPEDAKQINSMEPFPQLSL